MVKIFNRKKKPKLVLKSLHLTSVMLGPIVLTPTQIKDSISKQSNQNK